MGSAGLQQLDEGIWRWERRHPEWHPGAFGAVVASYTLPLKGGTLLIDPLVDGADDPVLQELDRLVTAPVRILISIPYHTRSAEDLWQRYRDLGARIHGHELVAKRLSDRATFAASAGGEVGGIATFHRIGRPVRAEMPIEIPAHRAVVFGDAVVEVAGELRVWERPIETERRRRWYEERLLPSLRGLVALEPQRILVTHGEAVLREGGRELERALLREPWWGAS